MSRSANGRRAALLAAAFGILLAAGVADAKYGIGRVPTPEEIAAWDIDVRPDGQGLPEGRGTVAQGEQVYDERCASCHGEFGEGIGRYPELAGGRDSLAGDNPVKTVGSYWPYLSTVYDYIRRAMPFGDAQSLTPNELYALTAYLLYLNDLVTDRDFELSKQSFTVVRLPNEANFIDDPRPDTPTLGQREPCMTNCKAEVKILNRARVLDVTPEDETSKGKGVD